ncbi:conserved Plasmodium membrane protein, unknown function [Plasmodium relictum]|uniref:RCK N-terminal domain-containing protein n=1 Tax=Plasmodium relictum TaxID=85471 RepID=A0A1J1HEF3_PLARL|nr:conserved Plasmodium membrane protein, unknown function [Plasmodium relictum]CRH03791.1 conserved Plasmodium membrane protein, unknown function [Plasmodium relictum]
MIRTRIVLQRVIFIIIFIGIAYFFFDFMTVYESSTRYLSFLLLIIIYITSYTLSLLPEISNSINYFLFYKSRKRRIYTNSVNESLYSKRKDNNSEGLTTDTTIDTSFLYMNQEVIKKERNKKRKAKYYYIYKENDTENNDINISNKNLQIKQKKLKYNKSKINNYVLKKNEEFKEKIIIDSSEKFENIISNEKRKTIKIRESIKNYIELNDSKKREEKKENELLKYNRDNYLNNNKICNEKEYTNRTIESFLYKEKYYQRKSDESIEDEDIQFINKKKSMCFILKNILCKNKKLKKMKSSYYLNNCSNINCYKLDSFYDRNKQILKDTNFSKWNSIYLKFIINIKLTFKKFCKNTSFLIADIIITLLLNIVWLNVHKFLHRNNDDLDRGMFNWNTDNIPEIYNKIEGYLQYLILYDMCIKLFLFFSANYILSFSFLLNLINTPFFYIIVSFSTKIKYKKFHWLYLSCPFRFLNFLRIEYLFGEFNNYSKLNIPMIKLSIQIFVMIYTYACINFLIEQPCKGKYELYDYIFSGMQTVTTAALGKGTCFPFSYKGKFAHVFYIFMTFTYIHYKIRYLKNYIVEEKKIYGKIPHVSSHYFVIIGHIKPIALYIIVNELQYNYNNLDEIIILTSLPIKFYLNIVRLLNKKNVCQTSLCLYDLNKPLPIKIRRIISYSSGVFICNNVINTHHNITNDMETLKRYNEITSLGSFSKYISVFLNNMYNNNILLKRNRRHIICLNDFKMKLFAKTIDDCHGMFLLVLLFFINIPEKQKFKYSYILSNAFDKLTKSSKKKSLHNKKYKKKKNYFNLKLLQNFHSKESKTITKYRNSSSNNVHKFNILRNKEDNVKNTNNKLTKENYNFSTKKGESNKNIQKIPLIHKKKKKINILPLFFKKRTKKPLNKIFTCHEDNHHSFFSSYNNYLNYIKGIRYNIYKVKLPSFFFNNHFITIVQYIYLNYNAFVIGIIDQFNEIKLNPVHFFYTSDNIEFILLSDDFNILHEISKNKKVELDWIYNIESVKIRKKKNKKKVSQENEENSNNNNYHEINKLKNENINFNPVLNIFRVDNYLQAYKVFNLKNENYCSHNNKDGYNSSSDNISSNKENKRADKFIYNDKEEMLSKEKKMAHYNKTKDEKKKNIVNNYKTKSNTISEKNKGTQEVKTNFFSNKEIFSACNKNSFSYNKKVKKQKKKEKYKNIDFIILIYWPQSLNTFLKILFRRKKHNIIILSDQIPSYIYNNKLSKYKYNICYIQKSPLILFNLIVAGILECQKCIIFKNYLKLDSYQNIVSYNEESKSINFFEYMCENNDNNLIIIYNNIQNIFMRRNANKSFISYYIKKNNESFAYNDYLRNKSYFLNKGSYSKKRILPKIEQIKEKGKKKDLYLLIELNNTLSMQYLNNEVYRNNNILKKVSNQINKNNSRYLLSLEKYKQKMQFFNYGNLLVENIYKKIENIFVDNYFFYLYFLHFTSASIFTDELLYHLIGYTIPIKESSLNICAIEAFIKGTYADNKKKIKTDLLLKKINPKYHCTNFFFIFQRYLRKGGIIIGVYRHNNENNMNIVIPCPQKKFIMHKNDQVYVIQSQYEDA